MYQEGSRSSGEKLLVFKSHKLILNRSRLVCGWNAFSWLLSICFFYRVFFLVTIFFDIHTNVQLWRRTWKLFNIFSRGHLNGFTQDIIDFTIREDFHRLNKILRATEAILHIWILLFYCGHDYIKMIKYFATNTDTVLFG